jgi:hypothetical protein
MSAVPIYRGATSAQTSWKATYSSKGGSTEIVYKYKDETEAIAQAQMLQAQGYTTTIEKKGSPYITLTATFQADTVTGSESAQPPVSWELDNHSITRNLLECTDLEVVKNLSTKCKDLIEYKIKNPAYEGPVVPWEELNKPAIIKNAETVYALRRLGIEGRQEFTQTVTRTITVPDNYVTSWTYANQGRLLSRAYLIAAYGVRAGVIPLLRSTGYEAWDLGPNVEPDPINRRWYYGFLEQAVSVQTVTENRVQIKQTWIYDRYPVSVYTILE